MAKFGTATASKVAVSAIMLRDSGISSSLVVFGGSERTFPSRYSGYSNELLGDSRISHWPLAHLRHHSVRQCSYASSAGGSGALVGVGPQAAACCRSPG